MNGTSGNLSASSETQGQLGNCPWVSEDDLSLSEAGKPLEPTVREVDQQFPSQIQDGGDVDVDVDVDGGKLYCRDLSCNDCFGTNLGCIYSFFFKVRPG